MSDMDEIEIDTPVAQATYERNLLKLRTAIAQVFQDAQKSAAGHRKLVVSLKTIQTQAEAAGLEHEFNKFFNRMVNQVLPIKKNESSADRVVRFCDTFVRYLVFNEPEVDVDEDYDTLASRFIDSFMRHLLCGIEAKDRVVRYRVCQLIAATINNLGEVEDELYEALKSMLMRRLYDKEPTVRVQAALAISRLQSEEEDSSDVKVTELLKERLQHDPSADVRRVILFNLSQTENTLLFLLERARDVHPTNRRSVYSRVMKQIDFRLLTISDREKIMQWGLKDRDDSVRLAASKMFAINWIKNTDNNLIELLERLDVLNSKIADTAMETFFRMRRDAFDKIEFKPTFWENLSAEPAFLARSYNDFCIKENLINNLDEQIPEVTKMTQYIELYMAALRADQGDQTELEFVVEQLLVICETLDFGDEVGRRKMLSLLRNLLTEDEVGDKIIEKAVQVLRKVTVNERDFSQVLTEIISDIQDTLPADDDETISEEERAKKQRAFDLKSLAICQSMLELIEAPLETNALLGNLLNSHVTSAVRNYDPVIRERGVRCLGLLSLLSKDLATKQLLLFGTCYHEGHEELQIEALKIIGDLLILHGTAILDVEGYVDSLSLFRLFYKAIRNNESHEVQATAAEALCKLFLAGVIREEELLKATVMVYFHHDSSENHALRQILNFCLPVYAYSSLENQKRIANITVDSLRRLTAIYEEPEGSDGMVAPTQMLQQLLEWTDPLRSVGIDSEEAMKSTIQVELADQILKRLILLSQESVENEDEDTPKYEKKALMSALSKVFIPKQVNQELLESVHQGIEKCIMTDGLAMDYFTRNALKKFEATIVKRLDELEPESVDGEGGEEEGEEEGGEEGEGEGGDKNIVTEEVNEANESVIIQETKLRQKRKRSRSSSRYNDSMEVEVKQEQLDDDRSVILDQETGVEPGHSQIYKVHDDGIIVKNEPNFSGSEDEIIRVNDNDNNNIDDQAESENDDNNDIESISGSDNDDSDESGEASFHSDSDFTMG